MRECQRLGVSDDDAYIVCPHCKQRLESRKYEASPPLPINSL